MLNFSPVRIRGLHPKGLACEPAGDFGFLRSDCGASVGRVSGLFAWQVIVTHEIM